MKKSISLLVIFFLLFTSCKSIKYTNLPNGIYADIQTNKGDILLELYADKISMTVGNFISLTEGNNPKVIDSLQGKKFYNNTKFHRVIKNFMIQGGDPTGTGEGGAGYSFADEFLRDSVGKLLFRHSGKGILSMANSGKNTNSSQFFITHKATPWLDNKHTIFGKVIRGQEVVDSIEKNDIINRIEIIRVGKKAKKFDAPKKFESGLKTAAEKEKKSLAKFILRKKEFQNKMGIKKAIKTASGLKILTLKKGTGKTITMSSPVSSYFTIYTSDGTLIQSNVGKQLFNFRLDKKPLISGVNEAVLTMKQGGKARLFIPYYLGYGDKNMGPILAKSDLVFEIEIVKVGK